MSRRADERLVELGLVASRARAQAEIKAGAVTLDGRPVLKPSQLVPDTAVLEMPAPDNPWVSRGGMKLAYGLDHFHVEVEGAVALDIGASTGGFTQVLLARGARRVYAVDVGHDQLHSALRSDPRVISLEKTNARELNESLITERVEVVVADVSFISLKLVLASSLALAGEKAVLLTLVKPQFELGPEALKKGIVRDQMLRSAAVASIADFISGLPGWRVIGSVASPIAGGDGNEEFLLAAERG